MAPDPHINAKKAAAMAAINLVRPGDYVGLGTGTTARFVMEGLGDKVRQGLQIKAMASSIASAQLAAENGIEVRDQLDHLDITIDGADEVDPQWNLIKGGGGALLREKILAYNSRRVVIIVDASKHVDVLGRFPLPVEVLPFGYIFVQDHLQRLGANPQLRKKEGSNFITDNGNYIIDCHWNQLSGLETLQSTLLGIPGVVASGLFESALIHTVITGFDDGHTEQPERRKTL